MGVHTPIPANSARQCGRKFICYRLFRGASTKYTDPLRPFFPVTRRVPVPTRHTSATAAISDESLVEQFLLGDDTAFTAVYERYDKRLLTYLRTVLRDHPDSADDLFQESFVRLFRERAKMKQAQQNGTEYTPIQSLRAWLFRVAHNLAMSYLRSLRQTVSLSDEDAEEIIHDERLMVPIEESFAQLYGHQDEFADGELYEKLRSCVELLPAALRQVYVLREIDGLEYEEVAEITGCTYEAARMRISRARRALRKALEPYLNKGE